MLKPCAPVEKQSYRFFTRRAGVLHKRALSLLWFSTFSRQFGDASAWHERAPLAPSARTGQKGGLAADGCR